MSKKVLRNLVIATLLVIFGGMIFTIVMTTQGWNFRALDTSFCESKTHEVQDPFHSISIDVGEADIIFLPSPDGTCKVVTFEREEETHTVKVEQDTLSITLQNEKVWYDYFGIHFTTPTITIYLPDIAYQKIGISCSTGDVTLSGMTLSDLTVQLSTGDVELKDITCTSITVTGSTGDIDMERVYGETFLLKRTTGDVELERCDAQNIFIQTRTGDVEASLLTGKDFTIQTTTGEKRVPPSTQGGKCEVITTTGDIEITIWG